MKLREICCGLLLAGLASPLGAGDKMTMKVSPAVSFAPVDLVVRASVEADEENRALQVVAESPDFYRSSMIELNGRWAPRTTVFELRSLPGGRYDVTVRLFGPSGETRAAIHERVNVISPDKMR